MSWGNTAENLSGNAKHAVERQALLSQTLTRKQRADSLFELAEELQGILVPATPGADYRRRLHGELVLKAQSRGAESAPGLFRQHRKGILIGAGAVGSVASIVGVVGAFLFHLRHSRASNSTVGGLNPWR